VYSLIIVVEARRPAPARPLVMTSNDTKKCLPFLICEPGFSSRSISGEEVRFESSLDFSLFTGFADSILTMTETAASLKKPNLFQSIVLGGASCIFTVNFTHPIETVKT
jgi:hypothetical protein